MWLPSDEEIENANITKYIEWLRDVKKMDFDVSYSDPVANVKHYNKVWRWSVTEIEDFWASIWQYFKVKSYSPYTRVLSERVMPGARWFLGATLNFAEHAFRHSRPGEEAIVCWTEDGGRRAITWDELANNTASLAYTLRDLGIKKGDRVAAYMTAVPESAAAFLATASIGGIWVGLGSELAPRTVIDRFNQLEPKIIFVVDGYYYNGKELDKEGDIEKIVNNVSSIETVVMIPTLKESPEVRTDKKVMYWDEVAGRREAKLEFEPVDFNHPLWVLFTSGTTGIPKPVVHSQGGMLLEMYKGMGFHLDIKPTDRYHWYSTLTWMMWNANLAGLFAGATVVFFVGSPLYEFLMVLWRMAEKERLTILGLSAPFIYGCMKIGLEPGAQFNLESVRQIGSTAAPLSPDGYRWIYSKVKEDVWLNSASGGTDVCSGFVGGCPILPVWAGEMQCRWLGAKVESFNLEGKPVINEVGELVITEPMPNMPLYLWGDTDNRRYIEDYFSMFPGVWWHGDWILITDRGTSIIMGRSDSTIKRKGIRMGTLDIYKVVEGLDEIVNSLAIGVKDKIVLYVVLGPGAKLDEELKKKIRDKMKSELGPYFIPDFIIRVDEIPMTLNFKKLEVPIKKILLGWDIEKAVNLDNVMNPDAIYKVVDATKPYLNQILEE